MIDFSDAQLRACSIDYAAMKAHRDTVDAQIAHAKPRRGIDIPEAVCPLRDQAIEAVRDFLKADAMPVGDKMRISTRRIMMARCVALGLNRTAVLAVANAMDWTKP